MKEYTLKELSELLNVKSSKEIVEMYLDRIYTYDNALKSIGEINIEAIEIAEMLDYEKNINGKRSMLHGIPIVVKDNINTFDKMHTSAGSKALEDNYAPYDATIIKKLRDAGMIILGKANLSEFAYFMSTAMPCGFSSRFGQVESPYDTRIDPLGSSTGSAVSVAANLIPVSIGSETNGSLMAPARMNSVCAFKPSIGMVSRYGILPISSKQDTAGPMARTVEDLAYIMDIIYGKDDKDIATLCIPKEYDFIQACGKDVKGMKIGIINNNYKDEDLIIYNQTIDTFKSLGVEVVEIEFKYEDIDNVEALLHEFKVDLNSYLATLGNATTRKTLKDIIEYNKTDPETLMPYNQKLLELAEERTGYLVEKRYYDARKKQLEEANEFNELIDEHQLDAIVSIYTFPHCAILGNPTISVPAKPLTDLNPMSIVIGSKKYADDIVFTLGYAYEQATKYRIAPDLTKDRGNHTHASKFWDVTQNEQ